MHCTDKLKRYHRTKWNWLKMLTVKRLYYEKRRIVIVRIWLWNGFLSSSSNKIAEPWSILLKKMTIFFLKFKINNSNVFGSYKPQSF